MNEHLNREIGPDFWIERAQSFFVGFNPHLFKSWEKWFPDLSFESMHASDVGHLRCFIESRFQKDGSRKWIVINKGDFVLTRTEEGLAFCMESLPSSRDDMWYEETRHETKEKALQVFKEFCNQNWNHYLA